MPVSNCHIANHQSLNGMQQQTLMFLCRSAAIALLMTGHIYAAVQDQVGPLCFSASLSLVPPRACSSHGLGREVREHWLKCPVNIVLLPSQCQRMAKCIPCMLGEKIKRREWGFWAIIVKSNTSSITRGEWKFSVFPPISSLPARMIECIR